MKCVVCSRENAFYVEEGQRDVYCRDHRTDAMKDKRNCEHGRRRTRCADCGGGSICPHGQDRYQCRECMGAGMCQHGKQKCRCRVCRAALILCFMQKEVKREKID